ncbi:MAG: hypothetical protein DLM62_03360 [Pseudonocardiales bacterium]|nr:MAG: hypothetical protein DLM62_03360 [Pseudonocardiales bacterium]
MIGAVPPRDDTGTTRPDRRCSGCGERFTPTGRALHCSSTCRKRVFRTRHRAPAMVELAGVPPRGTRREHTVYQCPDCGDRQLGVQRCADCGRFGRALGLGGACPGCGDPVTLDDLDLERGASR